MKKTDAMRISILLASVTACMRVTATPPDAGHDGNSNDAAHGDASSEVATINYMTSYPSYDIVAGAYACPTTLMQPINIYVPVAPAGTKLPLLVFFPGTLATATDGLSTTLAKRAAQRGFVAAAIEYHSWDLLMWPERMDAKARCVFDSNISTSSAISQLCTNQGPLASSNVQADCSKGIVVAGHSQGGVMALLANNYDSRVRAAYVLDAATAYNASGPCTNIFDPHYNIACAMFTSLFPYVADPAVVLAEAGAYGTLQFGTSNHRVLPSAAITIETGEQDPYFAAPGETTVMPAEIASAMNGVTHLTCAASAACTGTAQDGRWFEVSSTQLDAALQVPPFAGAGHCWFSDGQDLGCTNGMYIPDPNYFAPGATAAWTLDANLAWLATFTGP